MPEGDFILFHSVLFDKKFKSYVIRQMDDIPIDKKILKIYPLGKLMIMELSENEYIHIHLGLAGEFSYDEENARHFIKMEKNNTFAVLAIIDKINLSKVGVFDMEEHEKIIKKMGISIYDEHFTLDYFVDCCRKTKKMVCSFLMDQSKFCGIGNFMKNEIIYLSNIAIDAKMNELTKKNITTLYENILFVAYSNVLTYFYNAKIKTFPTEYSKNIPDILEIPYNIKIYKKESVNGIPVKKIKIGQRDTYYL